MMPAMSSAIQARSTSMSDGRIANPTNTSSGKATNPVSRSSTTDPNAIVEESTVFEARGDRSTSPPGAGASAGGSPPRRRAPCRRPQDRPSASAPLERQDQAPHRDLVPDLHLQLLDDAGGRRGHVHRRLVGLERDQRVLGRDLSPGETRISMTGTSVKSPMSGTLTSITAAPSACPQHRHQVLHEARGGAPSITRWS